MPNAWPQHIDSLTSALFAAIVKLYPVTYRERYGAEMQVTFEDCCRDAYARRGIFGLLILCLVSSLDFARAAVQKHREYGLSARARKRLRLASLLAFGVGLVGILTPYGAVRGVLVAPTLVGASVLGLYLTSNPTGPKRAGRITDKDARIQRAYRSLLVAACFAGLMLMGNLAQATEGDLRSLGGAVGYLSMVGSHLFFFGLGLWLYRRGSTWALLPALTIGSAWIFYSTGDVVGIFSGQFTGNALSAVLSIGSMASAAAVWVTGLLGAPALLGGGSPLRRGVHGTDQRRTR